MFVTGPTIADSTKATAATARLGFVRTFKETDCGPPASMTPVGYLPCHWLRLD
jgi:hypothetical protein